jgi:hypothetical protein
MNVHTPLSICLIISFLFCFFSSLARCSSSCHPQIVSTQFLVNSSGWRTHRICLLIVVLVGLLLRRYVCDLGSLCSLLLDGWFEIHDGFPPHERRQTRQKRRLEVAQMCDSRHLLIEDFQLFPQAHQRDVNTQECELDAPNRPPAPRGARPPVHCPQRLPCRGG